jgi:WD40 repeat protein
LDYFKGDKPYLLSGADDFTIRIWDYQIKSCLHTLGNFFLIYSNYRGSFS